MARSDGTNPSLIRTADGWDLYVNGVKVFSITGQDLLIKGDLKANEPL